MLHFVPVEETDHVLTFQKCFTQTFPPASGRSTEHPILTFLCRRHGFAIGLLQTRTIFLVFTTYLLRSEIEIVWS